MDEPAEKSDARGYREMALSQAAHDLRGQSPPQEVVARAKVYHDFLLGKSDK